MLKKEQKIILAKRFFRFCFIILFICFLTLYFSQTAGYYEYEQHNKTTLTKEQIEKFEQDVASGKNVDIDDYVITKNQDYSNNISDLGYNVSKNIGNYVTSGIEGTFNTINKLVGG